MNKEELLEHQKNVILAAANEGLRDYFAAAAMQGLLAADQEVGWKVNDCAKRAYAQADAMLKERERGE